MTANKDGDEMAVPEECIDAARDLARLAMEAIGDVPDGCHLGYAMISAALQILLPAVMEATSASGTGDTSYIVQGIGAGLAAFLGRSDDGDPSGRGLYLALMHDLTTGMANVEATTFAGTTPGDRAREFLSEPGFVITPGKGTN